MFLFLALRGIGGGGGEDVGKGTEKKLHNSSNLDV